MDKLFITVLNMSLTGAYVIVAVIFARFVLKKAPKIISYCLWLVVAFRLLVPFSFESALSFIPFNANPIAEEYFYISSDWTPPETATAVPERATAPSFTPAESEPKPEFELLSLVWVAGLVVMLVYGIVSYFFLKYKMRGAPKMDGNIHEAENIQSPFVLGFLAPQIYLPVGLSEQERHYIVLHERTHIKRCDHLIKFVAYFILCLHWFNPLAWVAFFLMGADMEMSCDERVMKELGGETKKAYSLSLLALATERRFIGGSPLAFGEGGVKGRIKNVLKFKKPSRVIIILAVLFAVSLGIGFAVNRVADGRIFPMSMSNVHKEPHFRGVVTEVREDSILVRVNEGEDVRLISDLIYVSRDVTLNDSKGTHFFTGDEVIVYYNGDVLESYPAQIYTVYAIVQISKDRRISADDVTVWVDFRNMESEESMWAATHDLTLDEFPGVMFSCNAYQVTALEAEGERVLFDGLPIWNVYLTDLSGDNLPEICASVSYGSGLVSGHVIVYDYANDVRYELNDRLYYDYYLSVVDWRFVVVQVPSMLVGSAGVVEGSLAIIDGELMVFGIDRTLPELEPRETASPNSSYAPGGSNDSAVYTAQLSQNTYTFEGSTFSDSTEILVTLGNGEALIKSYEGWYFRDSHLLQADLTGDGIDEIIVVLPIGGSNYGATDVHVLSVGDSGLTEILTILDSPEQNSEKEIAYRDSLYVVPQLADYAGLTGYDSYTGFCTGAQVVQTEDGLGLWVQHIVQDETLFSIIRWDGMEWFVAAQGTQ